MSTHEQLGPRAVSRFDCLEQLDVLSDVGLLPRRLRASPCQQAATDVGDPERVEHADEGRVAGRRYDGVVEGPAGVVRRGGRPRGALGVDGPSEGGKVVVRAPLGCEPRDDRLEMEPCLEPLQDLGKPEVGHEEAAVHLELDEPVADETPERLADGASGDAERLRQLRLADARAGGEAAVDDHRPEFVVREADDRADAKRSGAHVTHLARAATARADVTPCLARLSRAVAANLVPPGRLRAPKPARFGQVGGAASWRFAAWPAWT